MTVCVLYRQMLSDNGLDNIAGGNRLETYADGNELVKRELLIEEDALHSSLVRNLLYKWATPATKTTAAWLTATFTPTKK